MDGIIGYLILCPLAFAIGYILRNDQEAGRYNREKPLEDEIIRYRLQEAYRAGQRNPEPGFYFEAPAPLLQEDQPFGFGCQYEPVFPPQDDDTLKHRGWVFGKRINGVWSRR